jgi:DNA-binding transcriptional MerR regulator
MSSRLTIGDLARRARCRVETIRYYERIGLMPAPARNAGNQRRYREAAVERLTFIRHARDFGFPVEAVRELLEMADHPAMPCDQADALARRHLREVEARLARLAALKEELERMIAQCRGGAIDDCRIIQVLGDHRLCLHEDAHGAARDLP